jgi:WD40 repeat protein
MRRPVSRRYALVWALYTSFALIVAVGCGASSPNLASRSASQLRAATPALLRSEPRRALLYAAAAQRIGASAEGEWLLQEADEQFPGVTMVMRPTGTITALRLSSGIVTATRSRHLQTWSAQTGQMIASVALRRPIVKLAASYSPYLIASVDSGGYISLWNTESLGSPTPAALGHVPKRLGAVVGLGFVAKSTRLLVVTSDGALHEYDVLRRRLTRSRALRPLPRRSSPSSRNFATASATSIEEREYGSVAPLVALKGDGVFRIDPRTLSVHELIGARQISGEVTSLTYGSDERKVFVGTTIGTAEWEGPGSVIQLKVTGKTTGLAWQGSTLFAANAEGLAITKPDESISLPLAKYSGRAAASLLSGPGGTLELGRDGTVSLLAEDESGLNMKTSPSETSLLATFGPEGNLLESEGNDAGHVSELVAVRPATPGTYDEPNRIERRYTPSPSWWPKEDEVQKGLFVDDAELTRRYAIAGGQDPTGTAVVLVWDARSGKPLHRLTLTTAAVSQEQLDSSEPSLVAEVTELPHRHLIAAYSSLQELIVVWSTKTWRRVRTIYTGPIGGFDISSDESTLLVDSLSDRLSEKQAGNPHTTLRFVDLASGMTRSEIRAEGALVAGYLDDGSILLALKGGTVERLTSDASRHIGPAVSLEAGEITSWSLRPHSHEIAFATSSGTVKLMDLMTGKLSPDLPETPYSEPISISFDPTGRVLAASEGRDEGDKHVLQQVDLWNLGNGYLERRACNLAGGQPSSVEWRNWTHVPIPQHLC